MAILFEGKFTFLSPQYLELKTNKSFKRKFHIYRENFETDLNTL